MASLSILSTNSFGLERFGGIHTRKRAQVRHCPQHTFHIVEFNREKKYGALRNLRLLHFDALGLTKGRTLRETLGSASGLLQFESEVEAVTGGLQSVVRAVRPDIILIPGTSLPSYLLLQACRREGMLNRVVQEFSGVLEMEMGDYSDDSRAILREVGQSFVAEDALGEVTYVFPSRMCRDTVSSCHERACTHPEENPGYFLSRMHGISFEEGKHFVIWNGVPEELREGPCNRSVPRDLILGFVGRVRQVKNLPFFLALSSELGGKAKLKLLTDLKAMSCQRSLAEEVLDRLARGDITYCPPRPEGRMKEFYETEVSAVVIPSFFETYCNTAVESLVCGTTALLSDCAGAAEVYSYYGLSELVFSVSSMRSFGAALGCAAGREYVIDPVLCDEIYHDLKWGSVVSRYQKVYDMVVGRAVDAQETQCQQGIVRCDGQATKVRKTSSVMGGDTQRIHEVISDSV